MWRLCQAICLTSRPPGRFDIFDAFNSFDLDISEFRRSSPENSATSLDPAGVVCALPYSRVGEAMLKISLVDNARQRRVIVEGEAS